VASLPTGRDQGRYGPIVDFEQDEIRREALGLRTLLVFALSVVLVSVAGATRSSMALGVAALVSVPISIVVWIRMPDLAARNLEAAHSRTSRPRNPAGECAIA
jgi:hypothetical protein